MKNVMQINYWTIGGFDNAKPVADALREAKDMGYEGLELTFGGGVFGPDADEKTCRGYRETAEKYGVDIGIENVWNWFLADPVAMKTFVDQFNHCRVGCYFDVGNCVINGFPEHWIDILGHRVKAVHFKNYARNDDCGGGLHGFGEDLLAGDVNWGEVVSALGRINYDGPVTAELIPFCRGDKLTLPDPDLARANAPRLKKIMGK